MGLFLLQDYSTTYSAAEVPRLRKQQGHKIYLCNFAIDEGHLSESEMTADCFFVSFMVVFGEL